MVAYLFVERGTEGWHRWLHALMDLQLFFAKAICSPFISSFANPLPPLESCYTDYSLCSSLAITCKLVWNAGFEDLFQTSWMWTYVLTRHPGDSIGMWNAREGLGRKGPQDRQGPCPTPTPLYSQGLVQIFTQKPPTFFKNKSWLLLVTHQVWKPALAFSLSLSTLSSSLLNSCSHWMCISTGTDKYYVMFCWLRVHVHVALYVGHLSSYLEHAYPWRAIKQTEKTYTAGYGNEVGA